MWLVVKNFGKIYEKDKSISCRLHHYCVKVQISIFRRLKVFRNLHWYFRSNRVVKI